MKYFIFDIDNTIVSAVPDSRYDLAVPIVGRIELVNSLYDEGNHITYWTARGAQSGKDLADFTKQQLDGFGCKYHELKMGKPHYDYWVDDKAMNANVFFNQILK